MSPTTSIPGFKFPKIRCKNCGTELTGWDEFVTKMDRELTESGRQAVNDFRKLFSMPEILAMSHIGMSGLRSYHTKLVPREIETVHQPCGCVWLSYPGSKRYYFHGRLKPNQRPPELFWPMG